jgi:diguanylate cyclase (GGDEF)-like protein/PAS domain S-box-containing protein
MNSGSKLCAVLTGALAPQLSQACPDGQIAAVEMNIEEQLNQDLLSSKELLRITLACMGDAVVITDVGTRICYLNKVAESLTGLRGEQALGLPLSQVLTLVTETTREPVESPVIKCLRTCKVTRLEQETLLVRHDGKELSIDDTASPVINSNGVIIGAVLLFKDVSKRRQLARQLEYQALHDELTGLNNRRSFEIALRHYVESGSAQRPGALLYLDLDQFKVVNDTAGHLAGDTLLRDIGALIQTQIGAGAKLGRLGGDEFGVLLEDCTLEQSSHIANRLREAIAAFRFLWGSKAFTVRTSVGLVPILPNNPGVSALLIAADDSCYAAKDHGGNRVQVFALDDAASVRRHNEMQWVGRINDALRNDRLCLNYQPIVPVANHSTQEEWGEILVRMLDENDTLVPAAEFIPAAERYGLITAIDCWVFKHSLDELHARQSKGAYATFSINVSGPSLSDEAFLSFAVDELRQTGVDAKFLCFEITETAAISNISHAMRFVTLFKDMGCQFALDDFGTGLSSFAYLRRLGVDYVKIPGRFVRTMTQNRMDHAMVEGIHRLSQVMELRTIAEHVEDAATLAALRKIGIDFAQGNLTGEANDLKRKGHI